MTKHEKANLVAKLDVLEADVCGAYKRIERIRLDLQREWGVLPAHAKEQAQTGERD